MYAGKKAHYFSRVFGLADATIIESVNLIVSLLP